MLQVTLVAEEEAAGMEAVEPMTVILTLMDVGVEEDLDMFIPLLQLKTILTDAYSILLIISQILRLSQETLLLLLLQDQQKLVTQAMDSAELQI